MEAQTFCTKPIQPFCVDREATYQDDRAKDECRTLVKGHTAKMAEYTRCLEVQSAEAMQMARDLERRFDCLDPDVPGCPRAGQGDPSSSE